LGFKLNVMALTPSTMPALGTQAPSFSLPDIISGKTVSLDAVMGDKGVLVMFICGHCPFVVHVQSQLAQLGKDYQDSGLGIAAICSNDEGVSPRDSLANLKAQAEQQGFVFPYLKDDSQDVAKAYDAACTPDFFLYDAGGKLVYRGQLDASRPGNDVPVDGKDLRAAMDALIAGTAISDEQTPAVGCNIKWRDS
jgi:peroxiredoxin